MQVEVLMPVITGEGEDGVVTAWMVAEGGRVSPGQLIAEVQAEKVAHDVEAPAGGWVVGLVAINEPVPQGGRICSIADEAPVAPPAQMAEPAAVETSTPRIAASPAARRVARELGVDLAEIAGTGPGGRITEEDVRAAGRSSTALSGLRAVIARNMRESVRTSAPVTLTTTVDVTGAPLDQPTAWIVRAAARALEAHPLLNGTRDGDTFTPADVTRVSLAIQTDDGLVAPVIVDPAARSVAELHEEIRELAERARSKALSSDDYAGGTFSVTNLGSYGIDAFTPIINPPQVAILGVGAIRTVPGFDEQSAIGPRQVLTLSLTFDHAFVDGAPAAAYLADLRAALEGAG